jgi:hypothetical protein
MRVPRRPTRLLHSVIKTTALALLLVANASWADQPASSDLTDYWTGTITSSVTGDRVGDLHLQLTQARNLIYSGTIIRWSADFFSTGVSVELQAGFSAQFDTMTRTAVLIPSTSSDPKDRLLSELRFVVSEDGMSIDGSYSLSDGTDRGTFVVSRDPRDERQIRIKALRVTGDVRLFLGVHGDAQLRSGQILREGDQITTGHGSCLLELDYGDRKAQFMIMPGTAIGLDRLTKRRGSFQVNYGRVRSRLPRLRPVENYEIRTPITAIGVRGTDFAVELGKGYFGVGDDYLAGVRPESFALYVHDGTVELQTGRPRVIRLVTAGEFAVLKPDETPSVIKMTELPPPDPMVILFRLSETTPLGVATYHVDSSAAAPHRILLEWAKDAVADSYQIEIGDSAAYYHLIVRTVDTSECRLQNAVSA